MRVTWFVRIMKSRKLFCPGYLTQMGETRNMYMILAEKSLEKILEECGRCMLGKQILMWITVAQDHVQWWTLFAISDIEPLGSATTLLVNACYCLAQNVLSSYVLSKNLYAELDLSLHGKIIYWGAFVSKWWETCLDLWEAEVTKKLRKLRNKTFYNWFLILHLVV